MWRFDNKVEIIANMLRDIDSESRMNCDDDTYNDLKYIIEDCFINGDWDRLASDFNTYHLGSTYNIELQGIIRLLEKGDYNKLIEIYNIKTYDIWKNCIDNKL
jgi:hypothetical protein